MALNPPIRAIPRQNAQPDDHIRRFLASVSPFQLELGEVGQQSFDLDREGRADMIPGIGGSQVHTSPEDRGWIWVPSQDRERAQMQSRRAKAQDEDRADDPVDFHFRPVQLGQGPQHGDISLDQMNTSGDLRRIRLIPDASPPMPHPDRSNRPRPVARSPDTIDMRPETWQGLGIRQDPDEKGNKEEETSSAVRSSVQCVVLLGWLMSSRSR